MMLFILKEFAHLR